MQRSSERCTLRELALYITQDTGQPWYAEMGINIPGMGDSEEALHDAMSASDGEAEQIVLDRMDDLANEYLKKHGDDLYKITWPHRIKTQEYNEDARYRPM